MMTKQFRILSGFTGIALFISLAAQAGSVMPLTSTDSSNVLPVQEADMVQDGRTIHYATSGTPGMPKVLFVHGSPSSWQHFSYFLNDEDLQEKAFLIAMDRPGYGGSDPGQAEPSMEKQADLLMHLLDLDKSSAPAIIVGHSYGGAIVARMAMTADPRIASTIILAGIADPSIDGKQWYQYIADLVQMFLPQDLKVSNRECEVEKQELVEMLPLWDQIQSRVTVIQGLSDDVVPPENADFIERKLARLNPTIERIPNQGHLLVSQRPDLIESAVDTELGALNH